MENLKEIIQEKIENCRYDLLRTKCEINEIKEKCENANYTDIDDCEQYNKLLKKFGHLLGEMEAYIDCYGLIINMED